MSPTERVALEAEAQREIENLIAHHVAEALGALADVEHQLADARDEIARRDAWDAAYLTTSSLAEQRAMQRVATMPHKPWPTGSRGRR